MMMNRAAARKVATAPEVLASADKILSRTNRLFIGNKYVNAEGGKTLPVISPIDGKPFTEIPHASAADVDAAVKAARAAFDAEGGWASISVEERCKVLKAVAAKLREPGTLEAFAVLETRDCGKSIEESKGDIGFCADLFDYFADAAPQHLKPEVVDLPSGAGGDDFVSEVMQEPLGVVGCVTPWNYPLMQAVMKVAPALACGCTVVLKPSPLSSLTCLALGEVCAEAGVPAGVLNVITGGPPEALPEGSTGQTLIDHPLLDKISFTGSSGAGYKMLEASAARLRPTSLELGGKSCFVVFDDAEEHLDSAVDWIMQGIFSCTGQVCSATSRLLVQKGIEKKLMEKLLAAQSLVTVGHPLDTSTKMGPVVSEGQFEKVSACIAKAKEQGCTVHQPRLNLPAECQGGYFLPPTVLTDVPLDAAAWKEEIFGPVLSVRSFETEAEAVKVANDTRYGLANAVYTKDKARLARMSQKLKSGFVWGNCNNVLFPSTPFGGRVGKDSGFGHEGGIAGLMEYVSPKTVLRAKEAGFSWNAYIE